LLFDWLAREVQECADAVAVFMCSIVPVLATLCRLCLGEVIDKLDDVCCYVRFGESLLGCPAPEGFVRRLGVNTRIVDAWTIE